MDPTRRQKSQKDTHNCLYRPPHFQQHPHPPSPIKIGYLLRLSITLRSETAAVLVEGPKEDNRRRWDSSEKLSKGNDWLSQLKIQREGYDDRRIKKGRKIQQIHHRSQSSCFQQTSHCSLVQRVHGSSKRAFNPADERVWDRSRPAKTWLHPKAD